MKLLATHGLVAAAAAAGTMVALLGVSALGADDRDAEPQPSGPTTSQPTDGEPTDGEPTDVPKARGGCGDELRYTVLAAYDFAKIAVDRCDGDYAYLGDSGAAGDTEQLWEYTADGWTYVTGFPTSLCASDLEPKNPPKWVLQLFDYRGC